MSQLKYLQQKTLDSLKEIGGDTFVSELARLFLSQFAAPVKELAAKGIGERIACTRLMHQLKSSAGNLGAMELSRFCSEMEHQLEMGDEAAVKSRLPAFLALFEATSRELESFV